MRGLLNPFRVNWSPSDIADDLQAWFDASDEDTIVSSGGSVSQWKDKSPNQFAVSQGTGANQPQTGSSINGLNAIDFNGSSHLLERGAGDYLRNVAGAMVFAVIDVDDITGEGVIYEILNNAASTRAKHQVEASAWSGAGRRLDGDGYVELVSALPCSSGLHLFATIFDYGNAEMNWSVDGKLDSAQSFQTAGSTSDTQSGGMGVGGRPTGTLREWFDGRIGEIIITDAVVGTAQRQLIEGYLAWKWGI